MPPLLLLATLASAMTSDFEPVRVDDGCALSMRPATAPGGAAMRAECDWPDVDPARLEAMIADLAHYDRWVWPVAESRVERVDGGRQLVWQRQQVFGLADREVLLWARLEPLADGLRLEWTTAADEPLAVASGAVRTPRNEGYWEVRKGDGRVHVVHEIAVDPGGLVPRWIIELTRARGFARVMSDARAAAKG